MGEGGGERGECRKRGMERWRKKELNRIRKAVETQERRKEYKKIRDRERTQERKCPGYASAT